MYLQVQRENVVGWKHSYPGNTRNALLSLAEETKYSVTGSAVIRI